MFELKFEDRLNAWQSFRKTLETSVDPFQDVVDFYQKAPQTNIQVDPWDKATWLDPWELLKENLYCDFSIVLGCCYSLQLTERFNASHCEIHIGIDREQSRSAYLLYIEDRVIGWRYDKPVFNTDIPKSFSVEKIYPMDRLN